MREAFSANSNVLTVNGWKSANGEIVASKNVLASSEKQGFNKRVSSESRTAAMNLSPRARCLITFPRANNALLMAMPSSYIILGNYYFFGDIV
jgi:hypothetical protein